MSMSCCSRHLLLASRVRPPWQLARFLSSSSRHDGAGGPSQAYIGIRSGPSPKPAAASPNPAHAAASVGHAGAGAGRRIAQVDGINAGDRVDGIDSGDTRDAVDKATSTTPSDLSPGERALVDRIIRVDQAGELGANWIYRGQAFGSRLRGDLETVKDVEAMWETEKHHLDTLSQMRVQHGARPTLLYPLWQGMAFGLGAATALMGREVAMACTEAVETVIGEHYDDQLRDLAPVVAKNPHPSLHLMRDVLQEFRDDELEHLDTAVEEGAQKAPGHSLLSAIVGFGCKGAIKVCERV